MKIKNKGFTLIELMVTVAIIGILAAVAVPAYQDFVIRSKVTEAISQISGIKPKMIEYYSERGEFPKGESYEERTSILGLGEIKTEYIKEIKIENAGTITSVFSSAVHPNLEDEWISFFPSTNDPNRAQKNLIWNCASSLENKYKPKNCAPSIFKELYVNPFNGRIGHSLQQELDWFNESISKYLDLDNSTADLKYHLERATRIRESLRTLMLNYQDNHPEQIALLPNIPEIAEIVREEDSEYIENYRLNNIKNLCSNLTHYYYAPNRNDCPI